MKFLFHGFVAIVGLGCIILTPSCFLCFKRQWSVLRISDSTPRMSQHFVFSAPGRPKFPWNVTNIESFQGLQSAFQLSVKSDHAVT